MNQRNRLTSGILTPFSTSKFFPDIEEADNHGLLCIGGKLTPDWLIDAFIHSLFPWPIQGENGEYLLGWFSLDPRGIFELEQFHVSRRLARTYRSGRFQITADSDYHAVIGGCADAHRVDGTWITPEMIDAYMELFRIGIGHCIEVRQEGRLVGGVYGYGIRGFFAAESMFYLERDASKVALLVLIDHLKKQGYKLFDIQMITNHTASLGAVEISRNEYLHRLHEALQLPVEFGTLIGSIRSQKCSGTPRNFRGVRNNPEVTVSTPSLPAPFE